MHENATAWRVGLRLKAKSRCRVAGDCRVESEGILAETFQASSGILGGIALCCLTSAEFMPSVSEAGIVEPMDPNRTKLIEAALRFEGLLAPFGMITIDLYNWEWSWHYYESGDEDPKLYFSYKSSSEEKVPKGEPMGADLLGELTRHSLSPNSARPSLTLTLFREGENSFHEYRYIEAVRAYYLSIEHQCAESKTGRGPTTKALRRSPLLRSSYESAGELVEMSMMRGDISREDAEALFFGRSFEDAVDWLYLTRGELFHQKYRRPDSLKWNPSHHIPHKSAAIVFRAVCATMAQILTTELLAGA